MDVLQTIQFKIYEIRGKRVMLDILQHLTTLRQIGRLFLKNRGNEHYNNNMPHRGSVPTRNEDTIYAHAPVGYELWPSFELLQCANFVRLENFWLCFSISNLCAKVVYFLNISKFFFVFMDS